METGEREKILAQDHKDSVDKLSSMKSALLSVMTPKLHKCRRKFTILWYVLLDMCELYSFVILILYLFHLFIAYVL